MDESGRVASHPEPSVTIGKCLAIAGVLVAFFSYGAYEAEGYPGQAAYYPRFVAYGGIVSTVTWLLRELVKIRRRQQDAPSPARSASASQAGSAVRRSLEGVGVVVLYSLGLWIVGYWITTITLVPMYLHRRARTSIVLSVVITVGVLGVIWTLGNVLGFRWPTGVLFG